MGTTSACAENTKRHFLLKRLKRNYLRVRGEYVGKHILSTPLMELPPRARRIPYAGHMLPGADGTTSACAENTCKQSTPLTLARNYLRMRGEYRGNYTNLWPLMELPPHTRRIPTGKALIAENQELPPHARRILKLCGRPGYYLGTTSACAENTADHRGQTQGWGNYLRMRGEYSIRRCRVDYPPELPPHARRIPRVDEILVFGGGTTSACAENTSLPPSQHSKLRELPPHARRILVAIAKAIVDFGTTSACAENTAISPPPGKLKRNYLRMRGEYSSSKGSSRSGPGTTSACAENTTVLVFGPVSPRNYLRMRGEY